MDNQFEVVECTLLQTYLGHVPVIQDWSKGMCGVRQAEGGHVTIIIVHTVTITMPVPGVLLT